MMKSEIVLTQLRSFMQEAGCLALDLMGQQLTVQYKSDGSVVTRADFEISALAARTFREYLNAPDHLMIDEEDPDNGRYLDEKVLSKAKYLWALDPIDGTCSYANRMPMFGISLGIMKDLKPWIGMVYMPLLNEMFFADETGAYYVRDPFSAREVTQKIQPVTRQVDGAGQFLISEVVLKKYDWDYTNCHLMMPACAVIDLCWPAIGRGVGSILRCSLWDFAGSWPVMRAAGLGFYAFESGLPIEVVSADLFDRTRSPWKLRENYILSSKENFSILKGKLLRKS